MTVSAAERAQKRAEIEAAIAAHRGTPAASTATKKKPPLNVKQTPASKERKIAHNAS